MCTGYLISHTLVSFGAGVAATIIFAVWLLLKDPKPRRL